MKSDCRKSFGEYASPEHKNIASLVQGLMPDYQVYGIKLGVGSALDEDEWEGCENAEFRVYHVVNGTACHVDVFQHLQSTDPEEPCKSCPGHLDGKVTVCRYAEGEVCALRDDFVPMTWDHVSWADCPFEFRNFESIPGNYKYVERILVVGQPVEPIMLKGNPTPTVSSAMMGHLELSDGNRVSYW
ncbi:hypothetical protein Pmar_PMAR011711 [Perkinsus marinus ATCC 50983]|uniref:Uncharacterized protein n=1 Tax=Perkinsus marinus (strain ATCC 50983 / TXsc) TaxID=423536 RepID=C5LCI4_PERM5|nr:hypothetical protein Pmar_PMAR011711 [Perkinsus marinus ATCC 50983]EER05667.1 hypothetical protein Pmar_PMAR011711 [Perkinsus marinus ATCC 50983]|eukprot:XP_002773851.1 hypothetical protein Pmar_PMAR011711 [Perkinsus marinus ATCC 50983]